MWLLRRLINCSFHSVEVEGQHTRCKFPTWVTQHYHWRSLDYSHSFHFSHRNASLKMSSTRDGNTETKYMCHSVQYERNNVAKIVVHIISNWYVLTIFIVKYVHFSSCLPFIASLCLRLILLTEKLGPIKFI